MVSKCFLAAGMQQMRHVRAWCGRICVLLLLLGGPGYASAETSGVSVEFANLDTDWKFSDGTRSVRTNSLILKIEERSEIGLTVGAGVGYHWLRLDDQNGSGSTKFDAQNLQLYLELQQQ